MGLSQPDSNVTLYTFMCEGTLAMTVEMANAQSPAAAVATDASKPKADGSNIGGLITDSCPLGTCLAGAACQVASQMILRGTFSGHVTRVKCMRSWPQPFSPASLPALAKALNGMLADLDSSCASL